MAPPADPDALSPVELRALVSALQGKVVDLERTVAAQREEIARLKGLKARPRIKPSGMEQASEPKPPARPAWSSRRRQGGATGRRRGPGCRGLACRPAPITQGGRAPRRRFLTPRPARRLRVFPQWRAAVRHPTCRPQKAEAGGNVPDPRSARPRAACAKSVLDRGGRGGPTGRAGRRRAEHLPFGPAGEGRMPGHQDAWRGGADGSVAAEVGAFRLVVACAAGRARAGALRGAAPRGRCDGRHALVGSGTEPDVRTAMKKAARMADRLVGPPPGGPRPRRADGSVSGGRGARP